MSDWNVGDLAVLVTDGLLKCPLDVRCIHRGDQLPRAGVAQEVVSIAPAIYDRGSLAGQSCGCANLCFADGTYGNTLRFRKIRPDEHEACEEEFQTLLRRMNRKVSA